MSVERSPNYPQYSLPSVIEFARAIHKKEGMGEAPPPIVASAMGHEALTGGARAKIASLRQYGLMEGRGEKLRLTDRAFQILESPDPKEVAQATAEAAHTPTLFAEIHATKPASSDEAIAYWLRRERKFSADGAAKAVKAYRESTAALSLAPVSYDKGDEEQPKPPEVREEKPLAGKTPSGRQNDSGAGKHNVTGLLLEGGTIADVGFSGQALTREGVDMLIDYFKLLRRAIPETRPPARAASEEPVGENFVSDEEPELGSP